MAWSCHVVVLSSPVPKCLNTCNILHNFSAVNMNLPRNYDRLLPTADVDFDMQPEPEAEPSFGGFASV